MRTRKFFHEFHVKNNLLSKLIRMFYTRDISFIIPSLYCCFFRFCFIYSFSNFIEYLCKFGNWSLLLNLWEFKIILTILFGSF